MYFNWQVTTIYKTGHDKPKAKLNLTTPSITQCMQYSYRPRDRRCGEYLSCLWRWSSGVAIHSRVRHPTNWIFFQLLIAAASATYFNDFMSHSMSNIYTACKTFPSFWKFPFPQQLLPLQKTSLTLPER